MRAIRHTNAFTEISAAHLYSFVLFTQFAAGKTLPTLFKETGEEMLTKVNQTSDWMQNNYESLAMPFLCGTLVSIFATIIIYFDSDVPGLSPPPPFSPRKSER